MKRIIFAVLAALLAIPAGAQTHAVTLNWQIVQNADPAVGFYVYRQAPGSTSATLLNATALPVTQLTYQDSLTSNADGTAAAYTYYVISVDAAGNQSGPSNTWTANLSPNPAAPTNLTGSVR